MRHFRVVANTVFAMLCAIFCHSKSFAEPLNLYKLKDELHAYYQSGLYDREIQTVATNADQYITQQATLNDHSQHPKKLAIVLDIDETSLSYYENMKKMNFCYVNAEAVKNILQADAPAIKPILKLYQNAIRHHVSVFFVTARQSSLYKASVKNLKQAGFHTWSGLYTLPENYRQSSMAAHKTEARRLITEQGYTIIASIGDQDSDLSGGYAQKTFKLPNPFYYIA